MPTYNRSDKCVTLSFLEKNNIPPQDIYIFLANEDEKEKYISVYGDKYNWIVGVIGIGNQRNFITDYFEENEYILSMDDDIKDLIHKDNKPFLDWIKECIDYLQDNNVGLMSFCPSTNPFWFSEKVKQPSHKSFKCGNYLAVGVIHIYRNHKELKLNIPFVEDYERSIMYHKKYGATARYFDILIKTKYWASGGLSTERTMYSYLKNVYSFLYRHPNYVSFNTKYITQITKNQKLPNIISHRTIKDNVELIKLPKIERSEFNKLFGLLNNNLDYKEELSRISDIFCPFEDKSVVVTKNECSSICGECMLVSFGDYTGGHLCIGKKSYDNDCIPYIFNNAHSNKSELHGIKYSLYLYKN